MGIRALTEEGPLWGSAGGGLNHVEALGILTAGVPASPRFDPSPRHGTRRI